MDFGDAIRALKAGERVARAGWNGKGMWLSLTPGRLVPADKFWSRANAEYAAEREATNGHAWVHPYITMKAADGGIVPWLASQTDVLAEDWQLVD